MLPRSYHHHQRRHRSRRGLFFAIGLLLGVAFTLVHRTSVINARVHVVISTNSGTSRQHERRNKEAEANPLPPEWQRHHIFNGSEGATLDPCPAPGEWPPGLWLGGAAAATSSSSGGKRQRRRGAVLPFTLEAQRAIWAHQHPADCASAKFLVAHSVQSGFGSVLHVETALLRAALDTGRVLVEAPGHFLASPPWCGPNATTLDSCFFEPLTNCTLSEAEMAAAGSIDDSDRRVAAAGFSEAAYRFRAPGPAMFERLLNQTAIPRAHSHTWWRAQAAAYLVRPNARTRAELARRERDRLRGGPVGNDGCTSLYVRHGDKGIEAPLFEDPAYDEALVQLASLDPRLAAHRHVFLSTEDPATVAYFTNASASPRPWQVSWVDMPRKPDRGKSNLAYMAERGYSEEVLDGLLNLDLAARCDGFVASYHSNWARLIDELRSTVRCGADAAYMDVEYRSPVGVALEW